MAYTSKQWDIARAFYERGLSLAEIVDREEVDIKDRGVISKKAKRLGWVKRLAITKTVNDGRAIPMYAYRSYQVENPAATESMLHAFFHKKRMSGEWFCLNDVDLEYIDSALNKDVSA